MRSVQLVYTTNVFKSEIIGLLKGFVKPSPLKWSTNLLPNVIVLTEEELQEIETLDPFEFFNVKFVSPIEHYIISDCINFTTVLCWDLVAAFLAPAV